MRAGPLVYESDAPYAKLSMVSKESNQDVSWVEDIFPPEKRMIIVPRRIPAPVANYAGWLVLSNRRSILPLCSVFPSP
jgi:hypothetical protein